jgi:tetratricopeptide (TPR) repeat protein
MDSTAAAPFYALGRLSDARGDPARARVYYRAAKERDQLRFRAPEGINRHGATVVETQQALERAAPGGVVGRTLMLEHLHPNVEGYFLIADAFYEALRKKRMIGPWEAAVPAEQARREVPVTPVDSLVGLFRADRLLSGWPFQPAGKGVTPVVDTLRPRTPEEQLAQALVRGTLPWPEAMDRLRAHYESTGNHEQALHVARAMAQEYRAEAEPYMEAARIALTLGRHEEALRYVRAAAQREETPKRVQLLGLLLLRQGDHAAAVRHLRRAVQLAPGDERMQLTEMAAEAIPGLERDRARSPRDADVLFNLGGAYAVTQQYEKSREVLEALLRTHPGHPGAQALLGKLPA